MNAIKLSLADFRRVGSIEPTIPVVGLRQDIGIHWCSGTASYACGALCYGHLEYRIHRAMVHNDAQSARSFHCNTGCRCFAGCDGWHTFTEARGS